MQRFGALVIHGSEEVSAPLTEALRRLGVPVDSAGTAQEALDMLRGVRYEGVLLDDELPGGGSLQVMQVLEETGTPRVFMVIVPRERLVEARRESPEELEFVANPETEAEIERLALRMRTRLISAGLADDFVVTPNKGKTEEIERRESLEPLPRPRKRRPVILRLLAVLLTLLALLLGYRWLSDPGDPGETVFRPLSTGSIANISRASSHSAPLVLSWRVQRPHTPVARI